MLYFTHGRPRLSNRQPSNIEVHAARWTSGVGMLLPRESCGDKSCPDNRTRFVHVDFDDGPSHLARLPARWPSIRAAVGLRWASSVILCSLADRTYHIRAAERKTITYYPALMADEAQIARV